MTKQEPEQINKQELMNFYRDEGWLGTCKHYLRFLCNWLLQSLAKACPHPSLAVKLQRARGVMIGEHVYLGEGVTIDGLYPKLVLIEDYVSIGMNTMIFAHSNPTCSLQLKQKYYPRKTAFVVIRKGAWIAPGCIILCGVKIGECAVVGAGSVVTKDVEQYTVVAGNPAKLIKRLK